MSWATEQDLQNRLYARCASKGHEFIVPNVSLWHWESDLLSVTAARYAYEYEIKVSRSDFFRDAKKRSKHTALADGDFGPARFYYVTPAGLIECEDLPEHAGLIEVHKPLERRETPPTWGMREVVKPPRLSAAKLTDEQLRYLARGLQCRYWQHRYEARSAEDEAQ